MGGGFLIETRKGGGVLMRENGTICVLGSETYKTAKMPTKKWGKPNKTTPGLITGFHPKSDKNRCETEEKNAKRTNGSIFTQPLVGGSHPRRRRWGGGAHRGREVVSGEGGLDISPGAENCIKKSKCWVSSLEAWQARWMAKDHP